MGTVSKINNIVCANVSKSDNIAKANLSKIDNQTSCTTSTTFRVAMMVGNSGLIEWNTGSLDNDDHWIRLDTGGDVHRDVTWGHDEDGTECWVVSTNKTSRPVIVAKSDGSENWVPSGSGNWTEIKPSGGPWTGTWNFRGYRCTSGDYSNDARATFLMGAMNNSALSTYVTGGITDSANWSQQYRAFDSSGTNSAIYGLAWNGSSSASESTFALVIGGDVWLNANGTGSGDSGDWTRIYDVAAGTPWTLGYGDTHFIGGGTNASGLGTLSGSMVGGGTGSWGLMSDPGTERAMRGCATNMSGNWVIGGDDGYIWYSDDNGDSWSEVRVPDNQGGSTYRDWYDVAYVNNGTWVACGQRAYAVSTDNGASWTSSNGLAGNATYQAIAFNVFNTSQ